MLVRTGYPTILTGPIINVEGLVGKDEFPERGLASLFKSRNCTVEAGVVVNTGRPTSIIMSVIRQQAAEARWARVTRIIRVQQASVLENAAAILRNEDSS